eukprot:10520549-Heterocapsa_arctica.AAC.1
MKLKEDEGEKPMVVRHRVDKSIGKYRVTIVFAIRGNYKKYRITIMKSLVQAGATIRERIPKGGMEQAMQMILESLKQ